MKKTLCSILLVGIAFACGAVESRRSEAAPFAMKNLAITVQSPELLPPAQKLSMLLGEIYQCEVPIKENGNIILERVAFTEPQAYELQTTKSALIIRAGSESGAFYALASLVHKLGYRYYFPMRNWEIFPANPPTELALAIKDQPDYLSRSIWPGWGLWRDYQHADVDADWRMANRLGGKKISTGHVYGRFIHHNRKVFAEHPEYYALVNGERKPSKLCLSNPGLRKLFCDYVLAAFRKNPELESFSADPSDGGGWCECEACAVLGSPSNRAVMLANAAAEAVNVEFPGKIIGMYAYNMHAEAPTIKVHPQVIVNVATSFIKGGWTVAELIENWEKQGATIGIREYYYAGYAPGNGRGTDLKYLESTIADFYKKGARYINAESVDSWGPGGLGFYIAANLFWDTGKNVEVLKEDFFHHAFPGSQKAMREFYQLINGTKRRPLNADLLGRMYRTLDQAISKSSDSMELSRINDLVCYTRFSELFFKLEKDPSWENYIDVLEFCASTRPRRLVHSYAMYRDNRFICPGEFRDKETNIDWLNTAPPTAEALTAFVKDGVANNQLLDFESIEFSQALQPVTFEGQPRPIDFGHIRRFRQFYIWSDGKPLTLEVTGGLIEWYRDRGNVIIQLIQIGGQSDTGDLETLIQEDRSVPPDGEPRKVVLAPKQSGLHRITCNDKGDMTRIKWPDNVAVSIPVDNESVPVATGTYYFYVPTGTDTLGYYAKLRRGRLIAPDGKVVRNLAQTNGFYSDTVPAGMDGKVWELRAINGDGVRLLTVPSNLSLTSNVLLLPSEIIKEMK